MRVGVVGNLRYPGLAPLLRELAARAPALGIELAAEPELEAGFGHAVPPLDSRPLAAMLSLGGDGTLLRAARIPAAAGVPILTPKVDIANARIKFTSGAVANVTASRISQNPMRKLRIFERDAYLSIDFAAKNAEVFRLASSEEAADSASLQFNLGEIERAERKLNIIYERPQVKDLNPLRYELELFRDVIRSNKVPIVSGTDGLRALEVAESIMACIEKELSITTINSLFFLSKSLALKKGCANAKIKAAKSNKRVANSNHFLIVELFRVWISSSFSNLTLVNSCFLNLLN